MDVNPKDAFDARQEYQQAVKTTQGRVNGFVELLLINSKNYAANLGVPNETELLSSSGPNSDGRFTAVLEVYGQTVQLGIKAVDAYTYQLWVNGESQGTINSSNLDEVNRAVALIHQPVVMHYDVARNNLTS